MPTEKNQTNIGFGKMRVVGDLDKIVKDKSLIKVVYGRVRDEKE